MTTPSKGCDHSTGGAIIGGTLKRNGYKAVVRYAAGGRSDVNITAAEVNDLHANGIALAIVLEHSAKWLEDSAAHVAAEVAASREVCRACGLEDGPIFMAADFDATDGGPTAPGSPGERNMQNILASLLVAAKVIGPDNVGFYGSAYAIDWLLKHAPWIKLYWDTEAWSHKRPPHPKACLYQRATSVKLAGVSCDIDLILKPAFGQRSLHVRPPNPFPHIPSIFHPLRRRAYNTGWDDGRAWEISHPTRKAHG